MKTIIKPDNNTKNNNNYNYNQNCYQQTIYKKHIR